MPPRQPGSKPENIPLSFIFLLIHLHKNQSSPKLIYNLIPAMNTDKIILSDRLRYDSSINNLYFTIGIALTGHNLFNTFLGLAYIDYLVIR